MVKIVVTIVRITHYEVSGYEKLDIEAVQNLGLVSNNGLKYKVSDSRRLGEVILVQVQMTRSNIRITTNSEDLYTLLSLNFYFVDSCV